MNAIDRFSSARSHCSVLSFNRRRGRAVCSECSPQLGITRGRLGWRKGMAIEVLVGLWQLCYCCCDASCCYLRWSLICPASLASCRLHLSELSIAFSVPYRTVQHFLKLIFTVLQLCIGGIAMSGPSICQTHGWWQNESTKRKKFNYD